MINQKHLESAVKAMKKARKSLDKIEDDFLSKHKGSMFFYQQTLVIKENISEFEDYLKSHYPKESYKKR